MIRLFLKILLPAAILGGAGYASFLIVSNRPGPETQAPEDLVPFVETIDVAYSEEQLRVFAEGTVAPRIQTELAPEVSGGVIEVSPDLVVGGYVEEGDVLVRLDPTDFELAAIEARAAIAQAELRLETERSEAAVAAEELAIIGERPPVPLAIREPQIAGAEAELAAAGAALRQIENNLERTVLRAPYRARVRSVQVDIGEFASRGVPVATLYAVDAAEIRLPVPDSEIQYLDLSAAFPMGAFGQTPPPGPQVLLRARFAGAEHEWTGRIVRIEGEIDPRTRLLHAIARVEDPYAQGPGAARAPLTVGMFVEAEILGRSSGPVVVLGSGALRGDTVLVVDEDDTLRVRSVDVLRRERDRVLIRSGLEAGERVVVSPLENAVDGMPVETGDTAPGAGEGARADDSAPSRRDEAVAQNDFPGGIIEGAFHVVQLGAFLDPEAAAGLKASVVAKYSDVYVDPAGHGSPYHRVRIRRPGIDEARSLKDRLEREDGLEAYLVPVPERLQVRGVAASELERTGGSP